MATPIDVSCSNVKFIRQEIGAIVRYLCDKKNKISPTSQIVATVRIAPKICHGQPQQCAPHSAPYFILIGSHSAEL